MTKPEIGETYTARSLINGRVITTEIEFTANGFQLTQVNAEINDPVSWQPKIQPTMQQAKDRAENIMRTFLTGDPKGRVPKIHWERKAGTQ